MTLPIRVPALLSALTLIVLGGCSAQPAPTASTVTGSIAQASFASPVTKITATSNKGATTTATVGADGKFSIKLERGATYQLFLAADGKSVPIVLDNDLATTVHVKSGGATLDIGSVRFWSGAPVQTMLVMPGVDTTCESGMIASLGRPCASGVAAAQCSDDGDGETNDDQMDGEHADGPNDQSDGVDDHSDGEQQDDAALVVHADATQAMGIPERNITGDVGCGCDDEDDDGEAKDD